jgi:hypothetical protein
MQGAKGMGNRQTDCTDVQERRRREMIEDLR